jgi:TonB family protein
MSKMVLLAAVVASACHTGRERTTTAPRHSVEHQAVAQPPAAQPPVEQPPVEDAGVDPEAVEQSTVSSDEDALNAKRRVYGHFFNSVKRKVFQRWEPGPVWRRLDPTRKANSAPVRTTGVRVSLSRSGELASIVVTSPSGVQELDDEAVRAFRIAAPFGEPPAALAQNDGLITVPFSFHFQVGGQQRMTGPEPRTR